MCSDTKEALVFALGTNVTSLCQLWVLCSRIINLSNYHKLRTEKDFMIITQKKYSLTTSVYHVSKFAVIGTRTLQ